jgi:hypothetical protein
MAMAISTALCQQKPGVMLRHHPDGPPKEQLTSKKHLADKP